MEKIYCVACEKYEKFQNLKIPYILEKTLAYSILCSKYGSKDKKIFNEEESI